MKFAAAFGIVLGASIMGAYADPPDARVVMRHHGDMDLNIDANHDGWLTRAEAAAAADRMFDQLDTNHDGRLTSADRARMDGDVDIPIGGPDEAPMADEHNCTRTVEPAQGGEGQRVTVICNGEDQHGAGDGQRRVIIRRADHDAPHTQGDHERTERDVTVIVRDGAGEAGDDLAPPAPPEAPVAPLPPRPPHPPHAPHPPMFMMLMANSDETDTNGDGAISREEFRAQQLRFFDASDVNGDGRIRFERPPEAPSPPTPPAAPAAPAPPPPRH